MREALPSVRGVVAYSDPVERRDESGQLVKRGHIGTIYRATNAQYRGLSSRRTLWLAPSGISFADRALSKVRLGETGERYVMERLRALGAPRRQTGEGGADYVARLKGCSWLKPMRHPGNHTFTWEWRHA